jgi:16S rRNA (cytidine1402-2'-O)-methyltransferase
MVNRGKLILCGTPIGNLEDISQRALRTLSEADVIACEDTRRTRKLLTHHGIKPRSLMVYSDVTERSAAAKLVEMISSGRTVALVSDAGMPGLSDPGFRLVQACVELNLAVEVAPGPTAAVSALVLSGLPPARFVFEGFLPRKRGDRSRRIAELRSDPRTIVLYESPQRLRDCLRDLLESLGDRPAAVVREMTKVHEEVRRGLLSELLGGTDEGLVRGEIVVVVSGAGSREGPGPDPAALARRARELMRDGMDRKEAMLTVAREAGVGRRAVFDALVEAKEGGGREASE